MKALWQVPSKALALDLTFPLRSDLDARAIGAEVDAVLNDRTFTPQAGPHHNGRWMRLGLFSPSGDPLRTYPKGDEPKLKTPILKAMPQVEQLLDSFGPLLSASLSMMEPGAHVRWHMDFQQSLDIDNVRLHLPVFTEPASVTTIGHQTVYMAPGHVWYGDFTFPHMVTNGSAKPRLHIMFDVPATPELARLFPESYLRQKGRRAIGRRLASKSFNFYERLTKEGRQARAFRAKRHAEMRGEQVTAPPG